MEQNFFPEPLYLGKGCTFHSGKEKAELIAHHIATWRLTVRKPDKITRKAINKRES